MPRRQDASVIGPDAARATIAGFEPGRLPTVTGANMPVEIDELTFFHTTCAEPA